MRINALEVDGYGVWSGLKLDDLSDGLNVFYGPNEAGKTTLMQFVRSVLYGFTPQRHRYLPPVNGGRPGGSVHVVGPNGRFQVSRHRDPNEPDAPDEVVISASDGTRQGEHLLKVLLCNIDEVIFNNVFALGLQELQQLGTLSDTDAAALLYSLSSGLDRVALVEVVQELSTSRNRLLSDDARPCQVTHLLAERERLRGEIEELGELTRRYGRLAAKRDHLDREATRFEEEANRLNHDVRVIEIAATVSDQWQKRQELDDQLLALGPVKTMPEDAVQRLESINSGLEKRQIRIVDLKAQFEKLRLEAASFKINEGLRRLAPRIEALADQEPWITTLQTRSSQLETEITDLEAQLSAEQDKLGLDENVAAEAFRSISPRSLSVLRQPARALSQSRKHLAETEQEVLAARKTVQSLTEEIDEALVARNEQSLTEAMDRVGGLVARFRRRVQLDERLEEMDRHQAELAQQSRDLLERQVMPPGILLGLGAVFVAGAVMFLASLVMPDSIVGSLRWPLALLGLAGLGAAIVSKFLLDRSNAQRLQGCQNQISMLQAQIKQARQERDGLDGQLPDGDGPVANRLKACEEELAALEELVPLDAQRKTAQQEVQAAAGRVRRLQGELDKARHGWRDALVAIGLPKKLTPKQVRRLAARSDHVTEIRRRLDNRYEEYEQRRRELESLTERITKLADDAELETKHQAPAELIELLTEELREQETWIKRRDVLRLQARQLRKRRAKYKLSIRKLKRRRRQLLDSVGVDDEQEFRQTALRIERRQTLDKQRETVQREIEATIAGHCPEETIRQQLHDNSIEMLEQRHTEAEKQLEAMQTKLHERFEKRGELNEQLKNLANDRQPAAKRLELAVVEKRLEEAIHRWRVVAVASRCLSTVRKTYERERQPETLKEASGYLSQLTGGRYVRVWTPLDEDTLLVDDARGKSLPVEVLSQGAREQLFLCLRLALSSSFSRRGAQLPLVLDDVLVNFDTERAKSAVTLLREFAAAGQQLFVFTCHDHILKLFSSLKVPVNHLPDRGNSEFKPAALQKTSKRKRKRKTPPQPLPHEVVAQSDSAALEPVNPETDEEIAAFQQQVPVEEVEEVAIEEAEASAEDEVGSPDEFAPWEEQEADDDDLIRDEEEDLEDDEYDEEDEAYEEDDLDEAA